jgi:activator of HSP90 ATPase
MARIEEGDERWIVKDMGDSGKNVNNWHWTEKNITTYCKDEITKLFQDFPLYKDNGIKITTTHVVHYEGEAIVTTRKKYRFSTFYF